MNLPSGKSRRVNLWPRLQDAPQRTSGLSGDAGDQEIEDRLCGPLDVVAIPPPRKVTVDIHPGKAIDQRPSGNLNGLEVAECSWIAANASASVCSVRHINLKL